MHHWRSTSVFAFLCLGTARWSSHCQNKTVFSFSRFQLLKIKQNLGMIRLKWSRKVYGQLVNDPKKFPLGKQVTNQTKSTARLGEKWEQNLNALILTIERTQFLSTAHRHRSKIYSLTRARASLSQWQSSIFLRSPTDLTLSHRPIAKSHPLELS